MLGRYAEIIVDNRAVATDKPFTYLIGDDLIDVLKVGMRVIVPFGIGNRNIKGIVVNILDEYTGRFKLKEVTDVLDEKPLISEKLLQLSKWMKDTYLSSYLDSLNLVLPPGDFKEIETFIELMDTEIDVDLIDEEKEIVAYLEDYGKSLLSHLKKDLRINDINSKLIHLEDENIIDITIEISTTVNKKMEKWVKVIETGQSLEEKLEFIGGRAIKQLEIMEFINSKDELKLKTLMQEVDTSNGPVKGLEEKGLLEIFDREVKRNPVTKEIDEYKKHELNQEQESVFKSILFQLSKKDGHRNFLLHGVTGSGKTEIYLQMVEEMLKKGKDSIILVPEIALTPQTIDRFIGRFRHQVAVLHSGLSHGERFDQWRMIKEGKVKIAVGARSAVFAPFKDLGLIVIDEEHEDTYKSSQNPKYNTIEVAKKRVELEDGLLILGSATPAIETYYHAKNNDIKLLTLKERINKQLMPKINVVDMRDELNLGNKSIFSQDLYSSMEENLKNKKQTILFLNRRGFSSFVSCRSCGYVVKCEDCEISMTYHKNIGRLKCHYCGKTKIYPRICPECKSEYIKHFGIGTEQVEILTKEAFPNARVARMDADTMTRKGSYEEVLGRMKAGKIDILIGTQMISKGLDFKDVTLVGIIAADTTLNLPDYRSAEKGFQLITQVAGRAGRGDYEGKVILQTYDPSHYSIEHARDHDYINFYNMEIKIRDNFLYPPYINMISLLVYGRNNTKVAKTIKELYNLIEREFIWLSDEEKGNYLIGPYPAPLERIKNNFRWQLIIKASNERMKRVKEVLDNVCIENIYGVDMEDIKISIDINPSSIL